MYAIDGCNVYGWSYLFVLGITFVSIELVRLATEEMKQPI